MDYTPEQQQAFYERGRNLAGNLAQIVEQLNTYAAVFEARGGAAALGEYGDATLQIIYLRNDLEAFLAANNGHHKVTLARLRTDY